MIRGLNHITVAVSELQRSLDFYTGILGFKGEVKWDSGAYLSAGSLWLCLSCDQPSPKLDYTHIAFDVSPDDFESFTTKVLSAGVEIWRQNKSEGKSLYILDPDGHKLEIHAGSLDSRLESIKIKPYNGLVWL